METQRKYLIVGQGLAGTMLAYFLQERGEEVLVVDRGHHGASTKIAAGLINPVTGRRFVKSWRIEKLLPFARQTYRKLESLLGVELYQDRNIIRALHSIKQENDWLARCTDPAYQPYMMERAELGPYEQGLFKIPGYGEVRGGAQVKISLLIDQYRQLLKESNRLEEEEFVYQDLQHKPVLKYRELEVKGVIFCEGHRVRYNPFFNYLPFHGDKGEVLIVKMPKAGFDKCLKNKIFIVPMSEDLYWIGATYERRFVNENPSEQGKAYLTEHLRKVVKLPFEIVDHLAAVRPTVRDRRPFIGRHPEFAGIYLFNGMGTKGTSLAPYWANQFCEHLLSEAPLDPEVDIQRYSSFRDPKKLP